MTYLRLMFIIRWSEEPFFVLMGIHIDLFYERGIATKQVTWNSRHISAVLFFFLAFDQLSHFGLWVELILSIIYWVSPKTYSVTKNNNNK